MTLARLDVVLLALFLDHAARWFVGARVTWAVFWALRVHASARPAVLFERARVASTLARDAALHPRHPLARAHPTATAAFAVARHVARALALRLALLAALLAVCPRPFAEAAAHALVPLWLFVAWVFESSLHLLARGDAAAASLSRRTCREVRAWRRVTVPLEAVLFLVAAVEYVACGFANASLRYRRAVAAAASAAAARGARIRIRAPPAWLRAYPALTIREAARGGFVAAVAPHLTLALLLADFVDAASCARADSTATPAAPAAPAVRATPPPGDSTTSPLRRFLGIIAAADAIADDSRFRAGGGFPGSRRCRRCRRSLGAFADGACPRCRRASRGSTDTTGVYARREERRELSDGVVRRTVRDVPAAEALDATLRFAIEEASTMLSDPSTGDVSVTLTSSPGMRRQLAPFARKLERMVWEEMLGRVAVALEGRRER